MDSPKAFQELKQKIDSMVYKDKKESMKIDSLVTINWGDVISAPPSNSSGTTKRELEYLQRITSNVDDRGKKLIKLVDKESLDLFEPIARKYGLELPKDYIRQMWDIVWPVIYNLKFKFNRPRPEQLAPVYGLKVNVIETETHQTPAYPSGHTSYAALIANILSDKYPRRRDLFFRQARIAGYARCTQGVHYPSDNEAAMKITYALWCNLK